MTQKTRQNNASERLLMGGTFRQNSGMLTYCQNNGWQPLPKAGDGDGSNAFNHPLSLSDRGCHPAGAGVTAKHVRSRYLRRLAIVISALIVFCMVGCQNNRSGQPRVIRTSQGTYVPGPIPGRSPRSPRHPWLPPAYREKLNQWEWIIVHHTVTDHGPASFIDKLHREGNGWDEIGYHFVINNGRGAKDGKVEPTSRWYKQKHGAHVRVDKNDNNYWNEHSVGIGLIGNFEKIRPTNAQYDSLAKLVHLLQKRYNVPNSKIKGHKQIMPTLCPGKHFSFAELKRRLAVIR